MLSDAIVTSCVLRFAQALSFTQCVCDSKVHSAVLSSSAVGQQEALYRTELHTAALAVLHCSQTTRPTDRRLKTPFYVGRHESLSKSSGNRKVVVLPATVIVTLIALLQVRAVVHVCCLERLLLVLRK